VAAVKVPLAGSTPAAASSQSPTRVQRRSQEQVWPEALNLREFFKGRYEMTRYKEKGKKGESWELPKMPTG
jgi:hypothetical protein